MKQRIYLPNSFEIVFFSTYIITFLDHDIGSKIMFCNLIDQIFHPNDTLKISFIFILISFFEKLTFQKCNEKLLKN